MALKPMLARVTRLMPRQPLPERAFLPAALEIVETPASPTLRISAALISLVFVVGLAWSYFGRLDIIATASGKIIARAHTKVIQPFATSVVRAVRVAEGDVVHKGQVLLELDPSVAQADRVRYRATLINAQLDQARLHGLLAISVGATITQDPFADAVAPVDLIEAARLRMASQQHEQVAKLAKNDRETAEKRAEQAGVEAEIAKLDATIPLVEQRADIRAAGLRTAFGNKIDYLQQQQQLTEMRYERAAMQTKRDAAAAAIAQLVAERDLTAVQYKRNLYDDLAKADETAVEATDDLAKSERDFSLQTLTAPVDGTVQDLAVNTLGGIVTPAQQLLRIVPSEGGIEVEAVISNDDVGFVRVGQEVAIKIATFPYTRYGLISGHVREIAQDSVQQQSSDRPEQGSEKASDAPDAVGRARDLIFTAYITLDRTSMDIDGQTVHLTPGMAITADIKTGRRRVISYLLSPFNQHIHDAMHER